MCEAYVWKVISGRAVYVRVICVRPVYVRVVCGRAT